MLAAAPQPLRLRPDPAEGVYKTAPPVTRPLRCYRREMGERRERDG